MNLAIVIGVCNYINQNSLNACGNDAVLMQELLQRIGRIDDFCILDNSPSAREAKNTISGFIKKHEKDRVDELIFYYSGHGGRDENDFYFLFSDYQTSKHESTILRNSELDDFIRNFSPNLTVKIVDACYSGELYVKSEDCQIGPIFQKSAKERNLNNLYFFFSSRASQESFATADISFFTYCFLSTVADSLGEVRYRDIMAGIADRMRAKAWQEPLFITQASMTENFCNVNEELARWLKEKLPHNALPDTSMTINTPLEQGSKQSPLLEAIIKNEAQYCSQEEGLNNIRNFIQKMKEELTTYNFNEIFELEINDIPDSEEIVNSKEIGKWLSKKQDEELFATPTYQKITYKAEEYREIPPKPVNQLNVFAVSVDSILGRQFRTPEYRLETVTKQRNEINGFKYTLSFDSYGVKCLFKPKFIAIDQYFFIVSFVFSPKVLILFYSIEKLFKITWDQYTNPQCLKWQIKQLSLKSPEEIETNVNAILLSISEFINGDITEKLSK